METIKNWIWLIVTGGGAFIGIAIAVWRFANKFKKHGEILNDHEERIECLENGDTTTDRKLEVLNANVGLILNHFNIKPVPDLFDKQRGDK